MNCIDAIEGVVKTILVEIFQSAASGPFDDSEYTEKVKTVIRATDTFVRNNQEIVRNPDVLKQVLYTFSKELWLSEHIAKVNPEAADPAAQKEYLEYYFDHLYQSGAYPR